MITIVVREPPPLLPPPRCERCGSLEGVRMEPSRTSYIRDPTPWEVRAEKKRYRQLCAAYALGGQKAVRDMGAAIFPPDIWGEDAFANSPCFDEVANGDVSLCRPCAQEHHDDWDERSEYCGGLI